MVTRKEISIMTTTFCEKISFASLDFPCPSLIATIVEFPTAKRREMENIPTEKGMEIFTAVRAVSDTPRATKIPSTIV